MTENAETLSHAKEHGWLVEAALVATGDEAGEPTGMAEVVALRLFPGAYGGPDEKGEVALVLLAEQAEMLAAELRAAAEGGSAPGHDLP